MELFINSNALENIDGVLNASNLQVIHAAENRIASLPIDIASLPLRVLDVSSNALVDIPGQIGTMMSLRKLLVSGNYLTQINRSKVTNADITKVKKYLRTRLPDDELKKWEGTTMSADDAAIERLVLDVGSTGGVFNGASQGLGSIPDGVWAQKVRVLDLSKNSISVISPSIVQIADSLKILRLDNSGLTAPLPPYIGSLVNLTEMYLQQLHLTTLPREFANLQKLTILDLSHNKLGSIPEPVFQMRALQSLRVSGNELKMLPDLRRLPNLTDIDASHNVISQVTDGIRFNPCLKTISLEGNALQRYAM
jgi:Leucine-rich repeat (LRR) protein